MVKRGVEKRNIFLKPQDYHRLILGLEFCNSKDPTNLWSLVGSDPTKLRERLEDRRRKKETSIIEVLAFALMPNHIHLILREIFKGGISLYMQKLGGYTTYFNKQYDRVGSLFQSRFKDIRIRDDVQLHAVFAYVHTNPVELWESGWKKFQVRDPNAAMKKLREYWVSSYNDYVGVGRFPSVTQREFFLNFFGSAEGCRQAVEDWIRYKAQQAGSISEMLE